LIATPNVDNANRRQVKDKKLNYKLRGFCMQKRIVFVFENYLDKVLVRNYAMGGFKKREWQERLLFPPAVGLSVQARDTGHPSSLGLL
jgi:hypothetical protein